MMHLRHGDRATIAFPYFTQASRRTNLLRIQRHPDRLGIGVAVPRIATRVMIRIARETLIEIALAGEIMIDPDDVRRGVSCIEEFEFGFRNPVVQQSLPPRVISHYIPAEEVEGQPAPLVLVPCLILKERCRERLPKILRLNELSIRTHLPDRPHRENRRLALVHERPQERVVARPVRIPMTVEATEA